MPNLHNAGMSASAEGVVRDMFRTFEESGDVDHALSFFDPAVEWTDQVVIKEPLRGHDGFRAAMERLAAEGYVVRSTPEQFEQLDDQVVVATGYTRLVQSEESFVDLPAAWVFVIRDGKIVKGSSAARRNEALAAIGHGPRDQA